MSSKPLLGGTLTNVKHSSRGRRTLGFATYITVLPTCHDGPWIPLRCGRSHNLLCPCFFNSRLGNHHSVQPGRGSLNINIPCDLLQSGGGHVTALDATTVRDACRRVQQKFDGADPLDAACQLNEQLSE